MTKKMQSLKGLCFSMGIGIGLFLGIAGRVQASPMETEGHFSVNELGAVSYTIPLKLPPGTAGVVPQLALAYSSQHGNDRLLGLGWNLSGLSAITRCPRTMAQDNARGSVNYDWNDRYCLDGQRLMLVGGSYGGSSAEYRTERDTFSKVVSYGTAGSGPAWFKVWTKSGLILEYGNTSDSRIEAQGKTTVREWAQNKVSDTVGNYYTIVYTEDSANGDYRPAQILYTGSTNRGLAPNNTVQFDYAPRADVSIAYRAGSLVKNTYRLTGIRFLQAGSKIREYKLGYGTFSAVQRSIVTSITECGVLSSPCLPPVSVSWLQEPAASNWFNSPGSQTTNAFTPTNTWFSVARHNRVWLTDLDGSGFPSFLGIADNGTITWQTKNASGFSAARSQTTNHFIPAGGWFSTSIQNRVWLEDINGDGLPDLFAINNNGIFWQLNTGNSSTGNAFHSVKSQTTNAFNSVSAWFPVSKHPRVWLTDINGDGLPDILGIADNGTITWQLNTRMGFASPQTQVGSHFSPNNGWFAISTHNRVWVTDVNGDGLSDIVGINNSGIHWQLSTGNGFSAVQSRFTITFDPIDAWFSKTYNPRVWLTDINGDGLPDILGITDNGTIIWHLNTGTGFTAAQSRVGGFPPTGNWFSPSWHALVSIVDVNGDGLPDIVGTSASVSVYFNTGNGFTGVQALASSPFNPLNTWFPISTHSRVWITDITGDGLPDVIGLDDSGMRWLTAKGTGTTSASATAGRFGLVNKINTGLSSSSRPSVSVEYAPLTDSSVHQKTTAAYPRVHVRAPLYVASRVYLPASDLGHENIPYGRDGTVPGTQMARYTYKGLTAELGTTGRGLLGFEQTSIHEYEKKRTTSTSHRLDWPYTGLPSQVKVEVSDVNSYGNSVTQSKQISYAYACKNPQTGGACTVATGQHYFPYVSQSVETASYNNSSLPSITTGKQYDSYGNATKVAVDTNDGFSKVTTNVYHNDTANWILGRLLRSTVQSSRSGQ